MDDDDYVYNNDENYEGNYSGGGGGMSDDEDELEENDTVDEFGETRSLEPKQNYRVLKEEEIVQLEEDEIARASTILSISKAAACLLLPHFNWNGDKLQDEWFADEDKVREKVGLFKEPVVINVPKKENEPAVVQFTCGICFDDHSSDSRSMFSAGCGHLFCQGCWKGYVRTSIHEGPSCLMLRCPEPSCKVVVGPDLISGLASKQDHERYKHYLVRSYVEQHRKIKWCPAPNCEYAVKFDADGTASYDVWCLCSNGFCWNCTEEIHRPVDCGTVAKWILKNKDDSQNAEWMLTNTKPCPKCQRAIEKNQGCNHMTCRAPCRFEFCWLCLGDWTKGYCNCNRYRPTKEDDADPEDEHAKTQLFEHLQGHAEFSLERLHQCAENDLEQFLLANGQLEKFSDFRVKLINLTKVTANYFKKLVTALENGLSEVDI